MSQFPLLTRGKVLAAITTRFAFFTGKGGVGKTSLACSTAVTLAEVGKRVLLVSTDPASNLDETFRLKLSGRPISVPGVDGLKAMNIDPEEAAEAYRRRVIEPLIGSASQAEIDGLREQLSGACTTEIAAFDEFATLFANEETTNEFNYILFDTAPTGHTLRLLSLPKAWTQFFDVNERGASCLGPHSALKNQQARFESAFVHLADANMTTVVLVARPDRGSIQEAARTSGDLADLGLRRQILVINAIFQARDRNDTLAIKLEEASNSILRELPENLATLDKFVVPLRAFNTVGLEAVRNLLGNDESVPSVARPETMPKPVANWSLKALADELAGKDHALVLVMGKGGVGKTTVAAALAVSLANRGVPVHLSTTDPAAHVAGTFENLKVSRIESQLFFAVGQLNGLNGAPDLQRLGVSIQDTARRIDGRYDVSYVAKLFISWPRERAIPRSLTLVVPAAADWRGEQRFLDAYGEGNTEGSCLDGSAHDVTIGTFWYYYRMGHRRVSKQVQ